MNALIPTYALYGEYLEEVREDILHFEPLRDRSARHNWSIRPHKHDTLWQIILLRDAGSLLHLDADMVRTSGPVALSIPPLLVHGFQFPALADGGVASVRFPVMRDLLENLPGQDLLAEKIWMVSEHDEQFTAIDRSFENIRFGFQKIDSLRNSGLQADLTAVMVSFVRHANADRRSSIASPAQSEDRVMHAFCELIEDHYRTTWNLDNYARALGISAATLNRKCRAVLHASPQTLLNKRRLLEAKRLLRFTRLSVSEVADFLGFVDTSYFCRWFRKQTSNSPTHYRRSVSH